MIMTLTNKTTYELDEKQATALLEAVRRGEKFAIVQGDYIMLNAIVAIQNESRMEDLMHTRSGDYKCVFGEWHSKGTQCYGHEKTPPEVDARRRLVADNRTDKERYAAARKKVRMVREAMGWNN